MWSGRSLQGCLVRTNFLSTSSFTGIFTPCVTYRPCPRSLHTHRHDMLIMHQQGGPLGEWQLICDGRHTLHHGSLQYFSVHHRGALNQKAKPKETRQVVESDKKSGKLSTAQKVKEAGKDASYAGVFIIGFAVTGLMFYVIGRELFSGQSPTGIYGRALKLCRKNDELTCAIGTPVKGYGEMSSRGRRRHVSHTMYEKEGVKHMRMKFYVEGPDGKGTVHLEAKQNDRWKYEFRYIFAEIDDGSYSRRTFIIEDNR